MADLTTGVRLPRRLDGIEGQARRAVPDHVDMNRESLRIETTDVALQRIGIEPIYFFAEPQWFRPLYIGSNIWAGVGWGAIVYLAAMAGINPSLYESASIDGATRWCQIWNITLPSIRPTIIILLIFSVSRFISVGAEKILLMYNPLTYEVADVIATYVYRRGIVNFDYSYATAVGLFNSVVNLVLLVVVNFTARRLSGESLW